MDTQTTETKSNLSDDAIVELAHSFDKWLVDEGEKHSPLAIQMASIVLGRLMVFTNHTKCFGEFQELMQAIMSMSEPEAMIKSPDEDLGLPEGEDGC